MAEDALKVFESLDATLPEPLEEARKLAFAEGAIPSKYKYLMAMALDAAYGSQNGVNSLTQAAMKAGATKKEIAEAIRVFYFINGAAGTYTAARGLAGLF